MPDFDPKTYYGPGGGMPAGGAATLERVSLGLEGVDWIDDTAEHEGYWTAIIALEDTAFETLDGELLYVNGAGPTTFNGKDIVQHTTIYGRFTTIKLSTGAIQAIRKPAPMG